MHRAALILITLLNVLLVLSVEVVPKTAEHERKNPVALYILKDKVRRMDDGMHVLCVALFLLELHHDTCITLSTFFTAPRVPEQAHFEKSLNVQL